MATGQQLITSVRAALNDAAGVRWTDAELLGYLNESLSAVVSLVPEANAVEALHTPADNNPLQTLPQGAVKFLKVIENDRVPEAPDSWTAINSDLDTTTTFAVASGGGTWFAGSTAADRVSKSSDGYVWARFTAPPAVGPISMAYNAGVFVTSIIGNGVTGADRIARTADDGVTWTFPDTTGFQVSTFNRVRWAGPYFWAAGQAGLLARSTDGLVWTVVLDATTHFLNSNLNDVAYSPSLGLYVAVGEGGKVATSPDGTTWTLIPDSSFLGTHIQTVCWDPVNSIFVAGGYDVKLATSPDGVNWTQRDAGLGASAARFTDFAVAGGYIVAVASLGKITTSPDGSNWTAVASTTFSTDTIWAVIHDGVKFIAVGGGGRMAYSESDL